MTTWRIPVDIDIQPWFADHRFDGKVVLPAVETMSLLAADVARNHPEMDVQVMEQVCFSRFLEIPGGSSRVAALIEYQKNENGSLSAKLLSRRQYQAVTRMQEHGEVLFSPAPASRKHVAPFVVMKSLSEAHREIPAEQVYRELVPFGPCYHTLQETLYLSGQSAWGRLKAPVLAIPSRVQDLIGSPFPLDGALHAACVLGQRTADFVPFPVGFERRSIIRPTQPGGSYRIWVQLLSFAQNELVFDLSIFDETGQVFEDVTGLRMRDVSGGKIKPPEWMKTIRNEE